ncbi:hypothetical protein CLV59_106141 [Chitinophaga dinghuensis]|uniref:Uncharacterized protein n=1 Tax=Chitinophaga dinghuensis TaxID=1539050 RepID=A0A327VSQ7_9BACT|nr:hypothetical protein CLV59_106141 [Chitinophaga dinghuensis]
MNNAANNRPYAGFSGFMPLLLHCCTPIRSSTKWTGGIYCLFSQPAGNPLVTIFRDQFPENKHCIVSCCDLQPFLP